MNKNKTESFLFLLTGIVIVLMVMNLGLFLRMNQLQQEILQTLLPFQQASQRPESLPTGTQAPPFSLLDVDEQMVSLDDFSGESVVLIFSSTTCSACQDIYPSLKEFNERHPELAFLVISKGSDEENQNLAKQQGFAFPVLGLQDDVAKAYQVSAIPFFYLIDGEGVIVSGGFISSLEQLESLADAGR